MPPSELSLGANLCALFDPLDSDRRLIEPRWCDISNLVAPSRSTEEDRVRGRDRSIRTYDNTATVAASRLSSALSSLLISQALRWFILKPVDPSVDARDARLWMDQAQDILFAIFRSPTSGFYSAMGEVFDDIVAFGTGALFTGITDVIRYSALPLSEVYIANNQHGRVDHMFRSKWWNATQAARFFGVENLSEAAKKDLEARDRLTKERQYLHVVMPNDGIGNLNIDIPRNKRFISVYLDKEQAHIVSVGGFEEFPYSVARWKIASGEVYGTSPADESIDEIRLINAMKKTLIATAEKAADPPLLVDDDSVLGKLRTMAGGITYRRAGSSVDQMPVGDPRITLETVTEARAFIQQAFFNDILQLPLQDRMTATEVLERRNDQRQTMAPFTSRIQEELLTPTISRTIAIAIRSGILTPPPASLGNSGIRVEYVSPLAISQQTSEIQAVQVWINTLLPLAQIDPDVLLSVNTEELPGSNARALNVPERLIRSVEEVRQIKERRRIDQEILNAAQTGQQVAEVAKTAAEAGSIAGKIQAA